MARPRRETKQLFFDQFADFEVEDQVHVLDMLAEIHRQKRRLGRTAATKTDTVASAGRGAGHIFDGAEQQGSLLGGAVAEASNGGSKQEAIDVSTLDREPGTTDMLRIPKESE